jgi:NAD(P)-dependent dehydrogenase (short-subunit alcohol dehydrogenase family)
MNIVLVGPARGFGVELVEALLVAGARVVAVVADSSHFAHLHEFALSCRIIEGQPADPAALQTLCQSLRPLGPVHSVVLLTPIPGWRASGGEELANEEAIQAHCRAALRVVIRCLPHLKSARAPKVIAVAPGRHLLGPISACSYAPPVAQARLGDDAHEALLATLRPWLEPEGVDLRSCAPDRAGAVHSFLDAFLLAGSAAMLTAEAIVAA